MIRGLYTSAWSMQAESKRMDVIANNLANVNTTAYKKDTVVLEGFPQVLAKRINDTKSGSNPTGTVGNMQLGSDVGQIFTYFDQGQEVSTNKKTDMSIQNSPTAFFTVGVTDANGGFKEYYTRNGAFLIDANKQLVTEEGNPVLGENGLITLAGEEFSVDADGTVRQGNSVVDKLKIRDFEDASTLRKVGSGLFEGTSETREKAFKGTVSQGFLEQSNVNTVREMVDMISVMRSYEANQKVIMAQDSTLEKAVNEVGSLK